jgi:hypothetical protein
LIWGRKNFLHHESSLCCGGENWKVLESQRMAIYFAFSVIFHWKVGTIRTTREEKEAKRKG